MLIDEVNKGKKYPKVIRYFGKTKAMTEKYADQYVMNWRYIFLR
jgi:hypothetical protein